MEARKRAQNLQRLSTCRRRKRLGRFQEIESDQGEELVTEPGLHTHEAHGSRRQRPAVVRTYGSWIHTSQTLRYGSCRSPVRGCRAARPGVGQ